MAPEQVRILPIADSHLDRSFEIRDALRAKGIRAEVDDRSEKLGKKIRESNLDKVIYMFTVGDKEVEEGTVSVRSRFEGDLGSMSVDAITDKLLEEIESKKAVVS